MNDPYGYMKPPPAGMPTPYQSPGPQPYQAPGEGLYEGGLKDPAAPQPYGGMTGLDQLLQQRKAKEDHRQLMAQMLAGQQQAPQSTAPVQGAPAFRAGPAPVQTSPWSILTAGINGLMDGMKKGRQQQDPGGGFGGGGYDGGMKT